MTRLLAVAALFCCTVLVCPTTTPLVMAANPDDWTKELEAELSTLTSDMWGTQKRLEAKGFRVDSGNKSATGWWLSAYNRNIPNGNIRVQSDGTKVTVTVER